MTIREEEKATLRASLQMAKNERDELERLLDKLRTRIENTAKS
jgi:hypothetical protein